MQIDAAVFWPPNEKSFFFQGGRYIRYTPGEGVDEGYPKSIASNWDGWPKRFSHVDAAVFWPPNGKAYFFHGTEYLRYTPGEGVDEGYPKSIKSNWNNWPERFSHVDAAVFWPSNEKAYFFCGTEYLRYTPGEGVDEGYPKSIASNWDGWPGSFSRVDAAVFWPSNGKAYFFHGTRYVRCTPGEGVDKGYPMSIEPNWKNWPPSWLERRSDWMGANKKLIGSKKISELCLPGTHDSGTYHLKPILAADATPAIRSMWDHLRVGGATGIESYIHGMAKTQDQSFKEQLEDGIRYFDLRVCEHEKTLHTCHGLLGHEIQKLLGQMRDFLEANREEVVLVKVGLKGGVTRAAAEKVFKAALQRVGFLWESADKVLERTVNSLIKDGKRVLFVDDDYFVSNYDESLTTNDQVVRKLKETTESFKCKREILEAQAFRPVDLEGYVEGYVQENGCRIIGVLAVLSAIPGVAPILATKGLATAAGVATYFRSYEPVPRNLQENARNSRSITRDYFKWLEQNSGVPRPVGVICDYHQEVDLVGLCIRMSLGKSLGNKLSAIEDRTPRGLNLDLLDCGADALAAMLKTIGWSAAATAGFLSENVPRIAEDVVAATLQKAGWSARSVAVTMKDVFDYSVEQVIKDGGKKAKEVLEDAGEVLEDAGDVLEDVGRKFGF